MKAVNMSPQMVEAIAAMQRNAPELVDMLDGTNDFLLEVIDVDNSNQVLNGFKEVKVLRMVRKFIADFIEKEEE